MVLDLKRHLVTVHKLDRCCSLFEDLCEKGFKQKPLKRRLDTTITTTTTTNSSSSLIDDNNPNAAPCQQKGGKQSCSHDIGNAMANVRIHSRSSHSLPLPISSTDRSEADRVYQFESESDSHDCAFELADVANQAESSEDAYIPYIPHTPFQPVSSNDSPKPHHTQIGGRSRDGSACNSLQFIDTEKIVKEFHLHADERRWGQEEHTN